MHDPVGSNLSDAAKRILRGGGEMQKERLDVTTRKEQASILSNTIVECMISNSMTLENLDEACVLVKEVFRKDAMLKGPTKADPKF